jgi:hypothetical protein
MPSAPDLRTAFGLTIASALPLPELAPAAAGESPALEIGIGVTPRFPDEREGIVFQPGGALLKTPGVARYWIENGTRITVEPEPDAPTAEVRLFLLGSAMGAILHQRGLLPLHGNGIVFGAKAVCFVGHSGAGKSTLAAWFHDRRLPLLADDVCVVTEDADGVPWVQPGIPRFRLAESALEATGRDPAALAHVFDGSDKYNIVAAGRAAAPVPLSHVYLLQRAEPHEALTIRRLGGVQAVNALVANTYRGAYARPLGRTAEHLAQCLRLAQRIGVYEARRPWSLAQLDASGAALERHALTALSEA